MWVLTAPFEKADADMGNRREPSWLDQPSADVVLYGAIDPRTSGLKGLPAARL